MQCPGSLSPAAITPRGTVAALLDISELCDAVNAASRLCDSSFFSHLKSAPALGQDSGPPHRASYSIVLTRNRQCGWKLSCEGRLRFLPKLYHILILISAQVG